jgi:hypothetical protein
LAHGCRHSAEQYLAVNAGMSWIQPSQRTSSRKAYRQR